MRAVFPQFLRAQYGFVAAQAAVLAARMAGPQVLVHGSLAVGAAGLKGWLQRHARGQVLLVRGVGGVLLAEAEWTVWQGWLR